MVEHYEWEGEDDAAAIVTCHLFQLIDKLGIIKFKTIRVHQGWMDGITLTVEYPEHGRWKNQDV